MHTCPSVNGRVRVPWSQLVYNYFCLMHYSFQQQVGREMWRGCVTHGDDDIFGMADGTLRWVLPMDAWRHKLHFDSGLLQEFVQLTGGFIVEALTSGRLP
jgi:hypothetical protein